ncbi:hypothetical protein CONLIGDRAFT_684674 [Coniochaeta ligniaria NRRL 30616]|uniref:Uncharacterized protein n=1 Tax=Coniochaeta ligniaria NRRL 30616 TaxID=1408157 RepID=A0A1J7IFT4_9PEZI|nr:hypothetical protein CONLIGDRAFT_684674 [Coniochaeta ligniaria NRRL 30616]
MVRDENQNGDIPWVQYEPKRPRSRNSSLASIASIASVASITSMARRLSNFWRPNELDAQRRKSMAVPTEPKYVHVPVHAASSHMKTTQTPASRKASMAP